MKQNKSTTVLKMLKNKKLFINQVSYGKWIIEQILSK